MYPAGTPDTEYINYFLENTPSTPYGILFDTAGNIGGLQIVDVNGNPLFPGSGVKYSSLSIPAGYQSAVAEVDAIWTATEPTLIADESYSFRIFQWDTLNNAWLGQGDGTKIFGDTQTTTTAGTVATQWASQINLFATTGIIKASATSSGAVLTVTALAGYPIMILKTPTNGVVLAETTVGVQSFGYPLDLMAKGYQPIGATRSYPFQATVVPPNGYLSTGIYDLVAFYFNEPLVGSLAGSRNQRYRANLWIDQNGNNYAAWKTYFLSVGEGTIAGFSPNATKLLA